MGRLNSALSRSLGPDVHVACRGLDAPPVIKTGIRSALKPAEHWCVPRCQGHALGHRLVRASVVDGQVSRSRIRSAAAMDTPI